MKQVKTKQGLKSEVKARYIIGIDPGVNTGYAIWDRENKHFLVVKCGKIHEVMNFLLIDQNQFTNQNIFVRLEDARLRTWFGKSGIEKLQGAGSVKRDCGIWEDYLTANKIQYESVPPRKNKTKVNQSWFKGVTRWAAITNNHGRDAGMLVFNY